MGALPATMENCAAAIGAWSAAMEQLPKEAAAKSRAMYFFSGHGLEVTTDRQVMLPADYLAPPVFNVNEAISTEFLRKGLASSPVPQQFLFVDACRNDVQRLRELEVEGRRILNVKAAVHSNPDVVAPVFYAAASGTQAYQPRELERGYSLFGGALADGLGGADGLELACGEESCEIRVFPLHTYLKGRVAELLASFGSPEQQRIRLGGSADDLGITVVTRRDPVRGDAPGPPLTAAPALEARYAVQHDASTWRPGDGYALAHDMFGSENVTDIWAGVQIYDLERSDPVPAQGLTIRYVNRSDDTVASVVGFELPQSPFGHFLRFTDRTGVSFGCVLAGDHPVTPVYEIELGVGLVEPPGAPRPITRLEAGLSPRTNGPTAPVAEAWQTYEVHNLARAVDDIDLGLMTDVLEGKMQSPLAATVAAHLLLKARRRELFPESWLRNLSNWFPLQPDGAVLWAEALGRTAPAGDPAAVTAERLENLSRLAQRGLPHLSEVLSLAMGQLEDLAAVGPLPGVLPQVAERIGQAMRFFRPGGLFAVFAGPPDAIGPHLVAPISADPTSRRPVGSRPGIRGTSRVYLGVTRGNPRPARSEEAAMLLSVLRGVRWALVAVAVAVVVGLTTSHDHACAHDTSKLCVPESAGQGDLMEMGEVAPGTARDATLAAAESSGVEVLAHVDPGGGFNADVVAHDDHAYLGSWGTFGPRRFCPSQGVRVYDLSDPTSPTHVATFADRRNEPDVDRDVDGEGDGRVGEHPWFTGDLAAVSFQNCVEGNDVFRGFGLYDVTDPANPERLAFVETSPLAGGSHELYLDVRGDRVFVYTAIILSELTTSRDGVTPGDPDFQIWDVSRPRASPSGRGVGGMGRARDPSGGGGRRGRLPGELHPLGHRRRRRHRLPVVLGPGDDHPGRLRSREPDHDRAHRLRRRRGGQRPLRRNRAGRSTAGAERRGLLAVRGRWVRGGVGVHPSVRHRRPGQPGAAGDVRAPLDPVAPSGCR